MDSSLYHSKEPYSLLLLAYSFILYLVITRVNMNAYLASCYWKIYLLTTCNLLAEAAMVWVSSYILLLAYFHLVFWPDYIFLYSDLCKSTTICLFYVFTPWWYTVCISISFKYSLWVQIILPHHISDIKYNHLKMFFWKNGKEISFPVNCDWFILYYHFLRFPCRVPIIIEYTIYTHAHTGNCKDGLIYGLCTDIYIHKYTYACTQTAINTQHT